MARDLRFAWEEMPQKLLDEQQQKMRDSVHAALIGWAQKTGEATDYTENLPSQCMHPVGHWFEVPNLLRNGVLDRLLRERPQLKYLMLHNIDTVGADVDPTLLGLHIARETCLSFEVITSRIEDRGGGLARVNGRVRLLEGLAMPREEDEFSLSYYNTMTTWIDIDEAAGSLRLEARGIVRWRKSSRRDPNDGRENAHLHHAQGREEALGPWPGRRFPRRAIRKALGRHDRASRSELRLCGGSPPARPTIERPGPARCVVTRWISGLCGIDLRMGFVVRASARIFPRSNPALGVKLCHNRNRGCRTIYLSCLGP